jgi:hypothetical protein
MTAERGPVARTLQRGGRSDRFAAVIIFILSALYTRYAVTFQPRFFRSEALGPAAFPLMIGGLMLICSTILFIQSLGKVTAGQGTRWAQYVPALVLWLLLLGYSITFDLLGFPLSTGLFVLGAFWLLGVRPWWKAVLYAAAFTVAAWYVFTTLDVRLPRGEWFRR